MKNEPFDFSKHVRVPDEWVEKALSIPAAHPAKPRVFSIPRPLVAAACAVLVFALSISLYFVFRNITPSVAVAPSPSDSTSAPTTAPHPDPVDASAPTASPTGDVTAPSASSAPTAAPTQAPTAPLPTPSATTVKPTEAPADQPIQPPTAHPTQPITEPPAQPATESPTADQYPEDGGVEVMIPYDWPQAAYATAEEDIYCRIYTASGKLLGDSDIYAASHLAAVVRTDHGPFLYYFQPFSGIVAQTDEAAPYEYVFYNSGGNTLARGKI